MTLGFENRNKAIAVIAVLVLAVAVVAWELWPASTASASAKSPAPPASQNAANAKKSSGVAATLDPTLRFDLLKESEGTKYEGSGKNIFVAQVEIPRPNPNFAERQPVPAPQPPPGPPPPPPINLKFYGFAAEQGGMKQIFLAKDDAIFIAKEGDIVDRRYKVLHIYPMAVEIEDVLNNNIQQIPLTQG